MEGVVLVVVLGMVVDVVLVMVGMKVVLVLVEDLLSLICHNGCIHHHHQCYQQFNSDVFEGFAVYLSK